ncbi:hypothetical protein [Novipirellula rosea]|uniref:hypothetical protein n=1 Tax=Novipirellula rosea TaxID=1031540 RepID=UPI0031F0F994
MNPPLRTARAILRVGGMLLATEFDNGKAPHDPFQKPVNDLAMITRDTGFRMDPDLAPKPLQRNDLGRDQ